ncbi:MAG: hypothetical protein M3T56_20055 [Chloroflexota bacterium]|nr:hypothetical protein [Chloroflexota bacterium]
MDVVLWHAIVAKAINTVDTSTHLMRTHEPATPPTKGTSFEERSLVERVLAIFGAIGAEPADAEQLRLRKALLVASALLIAVLAVFWGLLYILFGEPVGGAIPLTYTVLSLASIVVFTFTRRYDWFRFTQLGLMLVLPFVLMVVLGGFIPSSVVAAWAFVAPLGALAFASPREAVRWFIAYLALLVATGFLGGSLRTANNLPTGLVLVLFVMNIVGVSVVVFATLYSYVLERDRVFAAVRRLFGQYLSPEVARTLLSDPRQAQLGGEIRDLTALFADLQGSRRLPRVDHRARRSRC